MPKLRDLSGPDLISIFATFGFQKHSQKGSHLKLRRVPEDGSRQTLTTPLHRQLDKGTLRAIYRQALNFIAESDLRKHFFTN